VESITEILLKSQKVIFKIEEEFLTVVDRAAWEFNEDYGFVEEPVDFPVKENLVDKLLDIIKNSHSIQKTKEELTTFLNSVGTDEESGLDRMVNILKKSIEISNKEVSEEAEASLDKFLNIVNYKENVAKATQADIEKFYGYLCGVDVDVSDEEMDRILAHFDGEMPPQAEIDNYKKRLEMLQGQQVPFNVESSDEENSGFSSSSHSDEELASASYAKAERAPLYRLINLLIEVGNVYKKENSLDLFESRMDGLENVKELSRIEVEKFSSVLHGNDCKLNEMECETLFGHFKEKMPELWLCAKLVALKQLKDDDDITI